MPAAEKYQATTGAFIEGSEITNRESRKVIQVAAVHAKKALTGFELIKIDAEGAEFEILSVAEEELVNSETIIMLELLQQATLLRKWVFSFVVKNSYKIFVLNELDGCLLELSPNIIDRIDLLDKYGTRDIVLCPNNKVISTFEGFF